MLHCCDILHDTGFGHLPKTCLCDDMGMVPLWGQRSSNKCDAKLSGRPDNFSHTQSIPNISLFVFGRSTKHHLEHELQQLCQVDKYIERPDCQRQDCHVVERTLAALLSIISTMLDRSSERDHPWGSSWKVEHVYTVIYYHIFYRNMRQMSSYVLIHMETWASCTI